MTALATFFRRLALAGVILFVGDFVILGLVHPVPSWLIPLALISLGGAFVSSALYWVVAGFPEDEARSVEPSEHDLRGEAGTSEPDVPTRFQKGLQFSFIWIVNTGFAMGIYEMQFSDGKTDTSILDDPALMLEVALSAVIGLIATRALFFAARKGRVS